MYKTSYFATTQNHIRKENRVLKSFLPLSNNSSYLILSWLEKQYLRNLSKDFLKLFRPKYETLLKDSKGFKNTFNYQQE